MCLSPRILKIARREFSTFGHQETVTIKCGKCAECQSQRKNEYYFRSYCHAQQYLNPATNGFIFFDTLTYRPEFVPKYYHCDNNTLKTSTHFCFSRDDVKNFWKRLRTNLSREGYDVNGNLTYFLTAEYGDTNSRPHYHFNAFVKVPHLTPTEFKKHINLAWRGKKTLSDNAAMLSDHDLGKTDNSFGPKGIAYRTIRDINKLGVFDYIAKYVQKDSKHEKWLQKTFDVVPQKLKTFHRSSRGYGLYALQMYSVEDFFNDALTMPDKRLVKRSVSTPLYFQRKLFYRLEHRPDKSVVWRINELGQSHRLYNLNKTIDNNAKKLSAQYSTIRANCVKLDGKYIADLVSARLGNRTWVDIAAYMLCFRGRVLDNSYSIRRLDNELRLYKDDAASFYIHSLDSKKIEFPDTDTYMTFIDCLPHTLINQSTLPEFAYFDEILGYLSLGLKDLCARKQLEFDWKQNVNKMLK